MLYESGLPKDKCRFVMPENLDLTSKLVSDKRIDFLSFIGSKSRLDVEIQSYLQEPDAH